MNKPKSIFKRVLNAVLVILATGMVISEAQANAGWSKYTDKANVDHTVPTFYANSPMGLHGAAACYTSSGGPATPAAGGACDTGAALAKFIEPLPLIAMPGGQARFSDNANNTYFFGAAGSTPNLNKYIPVALPVSWDNGDDYYEIAAVQYRHQFHSSLYNSPTQGTLTRGYVQIDPAYTDSQAGLNNHALVITGSQRFPLIDPITNTAILIPRPDSNANPGNIPSTDVLGDDGRPYKMVPAYAVDKPHYLGPVISASRDKPTRVTFINLLPVGRANTSTGARNGDLFLPVDETLPGAGFGPDGKVKFTQNRALIHLHGGDNPWISDGTPHQWITPAGEKSDPLGVYAEALAKGVSSADASHYIRGWSAVNVPDMPDPGPGAMTYYFPNGESMRMEWYHDHTYGLTRLNVYAGLASAYMLDDPNDALAVSYKALGIIPTEQIPLVFQDKTFVPKDIAIEDARWDSTYWGHVSDLWYPHVYEINQNPVNSADLTYPPGRWDWGPYFHPIFPSYYDRLPDGSNKPMANTVKGAPASTGLTEVTVTPEAFVDTPTVNGQAYPTLTVDAKAYRFRMLNALNDRYLNLGLYLAADKLTTNPSDPTDPKNQPVVCDGVSARPGNKPSWLSAGTPYAAGVPALSDCTEVKVVNADASYPSQYYTTPPANAVFPEVGGLTGTGWGDLQGLIATNSGVPDPTTIGPDIHLIGNETGYLAKSVTIPSTIMNYETNMQNIGVLNIKERGLFLNPAGRADVVIDFSQYAGKTLILYNDARAPLPAGDPRIDYFTAMGDFSDAGGNEDVKPGYGPNSRTIMQIYVNPSSNPVAYDPAPLSDAVSTLFAKNQPKPVVPEPGFARAYELTNDSDSVLRQQTGVKGNIFAAVNIGSICQSVSSCAHTGYQGLTFTTGQPIRYTTVPTSCTDLASCLTAEKKVNLPNGGNVINAKVEKKAIQELFEPTFGRMNATLGVELPYTSALTATTLPLGYVDPATEKVGDGETQFWRITHNGVDAHPVHFHLVNVQVINRVGWDGQVKEPLADELGWKETVVMHPLEDVIVAVQAKAPHHLPFGLPESNRPLDPSQAIGAGGSAVNAANGALTVISGFTQLDPLTGQPASISNKMANFGWEYVWHCHILGHEENDFMRPFIFDYWQKTDADPLFNKFNAGNQSANPLGLTVNPTTGDLSWTDPTPGSLAVTDPKNEIKYVVTLKDTSDSNTAKSYDVPANATSWKMVDIVAAQHNYQFTVASNNVIGTSTGSTVGWSSPVAAGSPATPVLSSVATSDVTNSTVNLAWTGVTGTLYVVQYRTATGGWQTVANLAGTTGAMRYTVTGLLPNTTYFFRLGASKDQGVTMAVSVTVSQSTDPLPAVLTVSNVTGNSATVSWAALPKAPNLVSLGTIVVSPVGSAVVSGNSAALSGLNYNTSHTVTVNVVGLNGKIIPVMATLITNAQAVVFSAATNITSTGGTFNWATPVNGGTLKASMSPAGTLAPTGTLAANAVSATASGLTPNTTYTVTLTNTGTNKVAVTSTYSILTGAGKVSNVGVTLAALPTAAINSITTGTLTWTAPAGGGTIAVTAVNNTQSAKPVTIGKVTAGVSSVALTGLIVGNKYTFSFRLNGASSTQVDYTVVAIPAPTAPAATLKNVDLITANSAIFNYTTVASATSYKVQQLISGSWVTVAQTVGNVGSVTASNLTLPAGAVHTFRVVSVNAVGDGAASTWMTIDLSTAINVALLSTNTYKASAVATKLTVGTVKGNITVTLATPNNNDSSIIYRRKKVGANIVADLVDSLGNEIPLATINGNVNTYVDTTPNKGTVYFYYVYLHNAAGTSSAPLYFANTLGVTAQ